MRKIFLGVRPSPLPERQTLLRFVDGVIFTSHATSAQMFT